MFKTVVCRTMFVGVLGLLLGMKAHAQTLDGAKQVDAVFVDLDKKESPGCALLVAQSGKIVYQRGYGSANLDYDLPITPSSVFYIASDSKQFTAFSVALLLEQGRLSLDDSITKYIPELPSGVYGRVTIAHLIYHTGGVRDYWGLRELAGERPEDPLSQEEFLNLMKRQDALNFTPGEQFQYSNAGYALLAILVRRVSGKSLPEFADETIFKPLGMVHTSFGADHTAVLNSRATGYSARDNDFKIDSTTLEPLGDGGLRTTVGDLFLWDQNFYHNKLGKGSPALIKLIETPGALNNGKKLTYAFGLGWGEYKGLRFIGHSGSDAGYRSYMARFPDQNFSVICLCNSDAQKMAPWALGRKVADIFLAGQYKAEPAKQASQSPSQDGDKTKQEVAVRMNEQELARYAGTFQDKDDGTVWNLFIKAGNLIAGTEGITFPLEPVSSTHFRGVGAPMSVDIFFSAAEPSSSRTLEVRAGTQPPSTLVPVVLVNPTPTELLAYTGDYFSKEIDTSYKIQVVDGKLYIKREHSNSELLEPLTKDEFKKGRRKVKFGRNSSGDISDFRTDAEGVTKLRFERKR